VNVSWLWLLVGILAGWLVVPMVAGMLGAGRQKAPAAAV
jgi:hypothetical protein